MQEKTSVPFSFDTAAVWALSLTAALTIIAFVPFFSVPLGVTKASIAGIGALIALVCFIVARLSRGNLIVTPLLVLGALWLVPLAYLLSTLFSGVNPMTAIFGDAFETDTLAFVILIAALASLATLVFRRSGNYRTFFVALFAGLGIALAAQLIFIVLSRFMPNAFTATGNLVGSFIDLGMIAGLAIILSLLTLRFLSVGKKTTYGIYLMMAVAFFVLVLVNSKLLWVLTAIAALGLSVEALMHRRGGTGGEADLDGAAALYADETASAGNMPFILPPLAALIVSIFFFIGGNTIGNAIITALNAQMVDVRPSWAATFDVGSHVYAASPVFGSGPGTFEEVWGKFRDVSLNNTIFWSVDFPAGIGFIPTSFVTSGLIGVLAWLVFLGVFFYSALRFFLFRLSEDSFMRYSAIASFAGATYVLALSFFATPGAVVLVVGFLLLGVFISSLRHGKERLEWGIIFARSPRLGFVVVFLLTLVMLAAVAASYLIAVRYLAQMEYARASSAISAGNLDEASEATSRVLTLAPSDESYRLYALLGVERMKRIANDSSLSQTEAQQAFQTALSESVSAATKATELGPNDYQNWIALGGVYDLVVPLKIQGAYEGAKASYERAIALNPTSPVLPYVLAQLEINNNNIEGAEAYLLQSVNLKHDYTPAILLLAQLEISQGRAREALQAAEAAAYFAPNDPSVLFQVGLLRSGTGDTDGAVDALSRAVSLNPTYANARFFLAAMYSTQGEYANALEQLRVVAAMSPENAAAVEADIAALEGGTNPFPLARLRSLGIPSVPVNEPSPTASEATE